MDFDSLKNQVSNLTLYDLKAGVRKVQNAVMNLTEMEAKVREATNGDAWGASATLMQEISLGTQNYQQLNEIMPMIYKRFTDKTAEEWRQIYKALQLLEFLVKNGSERVVDDARSHLSLIRMLRQFHFIDENGKDQGVNVRNRSAELVKLLSDVEAIRSERKKSRANKNKYAGVEGGAGLGMGLSTGTSGRYGGFGSESAGYGGYSGEVYGDGGGYGGRETDFSGTQRRGDQFEEYDAEEEGATSTAPTRTTATATTSRKAAVKKPEPVPDLFDFGDDEPPAINIGKAPSNSLDDFDSTLGSKAPADEDDFDDFQSAASPAVAQPMIAPIGTLSPPPTTSTTTSATQFAAPQPVAPAQTANFNGLFSATSTAPSMVSSPPSTIASPPPQLQIASVQAASYKPSGPNYYTSVNTSLNSGSSATSAFSARPGLAASNQSSFTSSTSAATLGKPTSKPSAAIGGDVFGNLWSSASTKAGVQNKAGSKGPDLASMAKAKSEAGIWGAAAPSQPRPGAIAPSPNTAAGHGRPQAPLGNGLDDLLG